MSRKQTASAGAFPMGFWNYCSTDMLTPASVKDWADAGMNLTMSPEFDPKRHKVKDLRAILDAAHKRGIRMIVCDARGYWPAMSAGEKAYREGFTQAVKDFGSHPAVVGFHVGDEPGVAEFDNACLAFRIQKELAPSLSPFLNLLPWYEGVDTRVGFAKWSQYLDAYVERARPELLCYDCYAQMNPNPQEGFWGLEMYFANLREFHEASVRHGIPFWTTLLSVGHFRYRQPREDDLRWQVNTAVAHGAKGLLWFFFYMRQPHDNYRVAPIDEHGERSETFEWLSRVNRTFLTWHAPVIQKLSLRKVSHVGKAWGGVPMLDGKSRILSAQADMPLVVSEFVDPDGRDYVAVVNNSQAQSTQANLAVAGRRPRLFRVGWKAVESEILSSDGWGGSPRGDDFARVQPWLAPGQMELYRVEDGR